MSDVIEGQISPGVSNAAVNAGGKLLKVVEMQIKYGTQSGDTQGKVLELCNGGDGDSSIRRLDAEIQELKKRIPAQNGNGHS